jgi:hypothetical protein
MPYGVIFGGITSRPRVSKCCPGGIHIRAAEEEAGVAVGIHANVVRYRRAMVLVRGVQHEFDAVQAEECPVERAVREHRRGGDDLKAEHIAVEPDRRRHVINLKQRRKPANFNRHERPSYRH